MPAIQTIRDQIYWSYANLARAHAALEDGKTKYNRVHHIIRNKIFYGLKSGKMTIRSIYDDERIKMINPQNCAYCGSKKNLSMDHIIPKSKLKSDSSDNLIYACRSCNSSKSNNDMIVWMKKNGKFPSILLFRRYIKIYLSLCQEYGILDDPIDKEFNLPSLLTPADLPTSFPPLESLVLWVDQEIDKESLPKPDTTLESR